MALSTGYVVVKIPDKGTVSKSAHFFDDFVEAVEHQLKSEYNTAIYEKMDTTSKMYKWLYRIAAWLKINGG